MFRSLAALLALAATVAAGEPRSYPAAKHGNGELRYIEGVPVLIMRGAPAEMGEQFGKLAVEAAPDLDGLHTQFLKDSGQEKRYPLILALANQLRPGFPAHHRIEMEAAAKASGRKEGIFLFANTIADLTSGLGCSTLVVEKERSKTGSPLFGRNFDWAPTNGLTAHTLVVVYKGDGKRAFAAITTPPIAGVISGMNDAGLAVTINEIHLKRSKDNAAFNWKGTPLLLCFRRVLEECGTVAEAEKLLREMSRTSSCCLTVCDKNGGSVFEITPANLEVRGAVNGVTCCTNHFRTEKLSTTTKCWRYDVLSPLQEKTGPKLDVATLFKRLDEVHQGKNTLQSMIFEPAERVLHFAYGEGPATRRPLRRLDLGTLFDNP
jgi:hypothetical protein